MGVARGGCDNKIVGDWRLPAHVQNLNIFRLLSSRAVQHFLSISSVGSVFLAEVPAADFLALGVLTVTDFFGAVTFFAAVFLGAASLPAEEVFFAAVFFAGVLEVVFFVFSILRYIVYFLKCSRGRWDLCPDCGCRRF